MTAFFIAARYLFAKKSHNVINVISTICAVGMGVGTAALILIMSVYNGFGNLIDNNMSDLDPDVLVCPAEGRYFCPPDSLFHILEASEAVRSINCVLEENVFFTYEDRQGVAKARGVDNGYEEHSGLAPHVVEGSFSLYDKDVPQAALGASLAYGNGINTHFLSPLDLYFPDAGSKISVSNPMASLNRSRVWPGSLLSVTSTVDEELMIVPLATMQELVGDDDTLTGIEIRLRNGNAASVRKFIRSLSLSDSYLLKDRYMQNPSLYRMMKIEKFAIFMILMFVVVIIAFNIFGSLSMLMIEKKEDCASLRAMGATDGTIRRIFVFEGWMTSLLGMAGGFVIGVVVTLLQQELGLVKMPGNYLSGAYPVLLNWNDVLLSCLGVALTGLLIALPASKARKD